MVARDHPLAEVRKVKPEQVAEETLITYPVETERLDIYSQFLLPAGVTPRRCKSIETTEILLHMVAAGRGVAALPRWMVERYSSELGLVGLSLGQGGIRKHIHLGLRESDADTDYLAAFLRLAGQGKA